MGLSRLTCRLKRSDICEYSGESPTDGNSDGYAASFAALSSYTLYAHISLIPAIDP